MTSQKITSFLVKQDRQPSATSKASGSQRQGTFHDMKKVQRLHKSSMCPDDGELFRLFGQLADDQPEQVIDKALKHLASYVLQIEQLERVPLAPRVKQLRQHPNPEINRTATNLVAKLREEVAAATVRRRHNISRPAAKQQSKLKVKTPAKLQPAKSPVKASAALQRSPARLDSPAKPSPSKQLAAQKTPTKRTPSKPATFKLSNLLSAS